MSPLPNDDYGSATVRLLPADGLLDFRLRTVKPLTPAEVGHVFGQEPGLDEHESLLLGDEHREDMAEQGSLMEPDTVDIDSDEDTACALAPDAEEGASPDGLLQHGLRIALSALLVSATIAGLVVVYEVGLVPLLTRFQQASWLAQGLFFTLGFYFVSLPFAWGYVVVKYVQEQQSIAYDAYARAVLKPASAQLPLCRASPRAPARVSPVLHYPPLDGCWVPHGPNLYLKQRRKHRRLKCTALLLWSRFSALHVCTG